MVGLVYLSIDSNLREKGGRPDNIYRFIDKLSDKKPVIPMPCASYMRRDELKTISNAHKVMVLCDDIIKNKGFNINTDGTKKQQRKLGGIAINGMVISVNMAITDISQELEQLRCTAKALKIQNANSIKWRMLVSSASDSASCGYPLFLIVT